MLAKVILFIDKFLVSIMVLLAVSYNFGVYKAPFVTFVVILSIMGALKAFMVMVLLIIDLSNFVKKQGWDKKE